MAEAPRWRYTRKTVSRREKILSLLVVLVLAGLAVVFFRDVLRGGQASPFVVDDRLLEEAGRSAETVADGYLAPSDSTARRVSLRRTAAAKDLADAELARLAETYRPRRIVQAAYDVDGSAMEAAVLEMDSPEWAFGLWAARRPADAEDAAVAGNRQAWRNASRAGFWAGKYYVETWAAEPANGKAGDPLATMLTQLGRAHLFYGRPFAAEALLPQEGLQAGSLRFEPAGALGIEALKAALVARYESGVTVAAAALGSPSQAVSAASSIRPPEGVLLRVVDRYLLATQGPQEAATALLDKASLAAQPVQAEGAAPAAPAKADNPLPTLADEDLSGPGEIRPFNSDTLYEKIDGKAQLYLGYNFVQLLFTSYAAGESSLDVYVYDMGQADNAFGIYKAEQSEGAEPAPVGRGGYFSGPSVFFWKGKYYVNVLAGGEDAGHGGETGSEEGGEESPARQAALKLATAIAEQLRDTGQSLWAEQVLPAEGRVEGSFEFRKSDAFNLDFLKDAFSAQYRQGEKELTLFVTRAASPEAAGEVYKQYEAFAGKYGKVLETRQIGGAKVLVSESSGTYDVVFMQGPYFGGAMAADDRQAAEAAVSRWVEGLHTSK